MLIEDLGSTNRTKVNGKLLKASTLYKLRSHDVIEFGQQKLQIFIGGKIAAAGGLKSSGASREDPMVFERLIAGQDQVPSTKMAIERFLRTKG